MSAAQYAQPTIRRSPTLLVREIIVPTGTVAAGVITAFDLPKDTVVLDAWCKVRSVGTGALQLMLRLNTTPIMTATVLITTADDFVRMPVTDAMNSLRLGAAGTINLLASATTSTAPATIMVAVMAYRESYDG